MLIDSSKKELLKIIQKDKYKLKFVINKLFKFGQLSRSLANLDSSMGNIKCPFHPYEKGEANQGQSAKVRYDEEYNIYTIHCFTFAKTYTCMDYIALVMQQDPYTYLLENRDLLEIVTVIEVLEKGYVNLDKKSTVKKISYVNNLFNGTDGDISEYIERLYT